MAVAAKIIGDADFWIIRYREIGVDNDPPTAIDLATRGLCQLLSQMGRFHASGLDHGCFLDSNVSIGATDYNFPGPHGLDATLEHLFDAIALEAF